MSLVINNNLMAYGAGNNLNAHYASMDKSVQRLSSGLRVMGAADDAAGLAVREIMRSEITSLQQGIRNANDGISLLQTADGALGVVDEKLIRMKELAEQAATGTYDDVQRGIIDDEYQAMADEITRISEATDFNNIKLLDGNLSGVHDGSKTTSTGAVRIHFGTGNDATEDYYDIQIQETTASALGLGLSAGTPKIGDDNKYTDADIKTDVGAWSTTGEYAGVANLAAAVGALAEGEGAGAITVDMLDTAYAAHIAVKENENDTKKEFLTFAASSLGIDENILGTVQTNGTISPADDTFILTEVEAFDVPVAETVGAAGTKRDAAHDFTTYDTIMRHAVGLSYADITPGNSIRTQENAQKALGAIDDAIVKKDKIRANIGALQNRLSATVDNLTVQRQNIQASESRISDVDVTSEMTNFVRNQTLTQAAVGMLGQANSMPQMAMQLIG